MARKQTPTCATSNGWCPIACMHVPLVSKARASDACKLMRHSDRLEWERVHSLGTTLGDTPCIIASQGPSETSWAALLVPSVRNARMGPRILNGFGRVGCVDCFPCLAHFAADAFLFSFGDRNVYFYDWATASQSWKVRTMKSVRITVKTSTK